MCVACRYTSTRVYIQTHVYSFILRDILRDKIYSLCLYIRHVCAYTCVRIYVCLYVCSVERLTAFKQQQKISHEYTLKFYYLIIFHKTFDNVISFSTFFYYGKIQQLSSCIFVTNQNGVYISLKLSLTATSTRQSVALLFQMSQFVFLHANIQGQLSSLICLRVYS